MVNLTAVVPLFSGFTSAIGASKAGTFGPDVDYNAHGAAGTKESTFGCSQLLPQSFRLHAGCGNRFYSNRRRFSHNNVTQITEIVEFSSYRVAGRMVFTYRVTSDFGLAVNFIPAVRNATGPKSSSFQL